MIKRSSEALLIFNVHCLSIYKVVSTFNETGMRLNMLTTRSCRQRPHSTAATSLFQLNCAIVSDEFSFIFVSVRRSH